MKKFISLTMAALLAIGAFAGCKQEPKGNEQPPANGQSATNAPQEPVKESKELNLLTWANYVPPEVIADFETETGIKVNYSYISTNEEALAKLQSQKGQYDVVLCSAYMIDIMAKEGGLIKPLNKEKLPNFVNIDESFQGKYYDPNNEYSIPHAIASAIIVYDSAKVTEPITGYKDLWNPNFKKQIVVLNGDRDIIGLTLMTMGKSINEKDTAVLNEAKEKLMPLKDNIIAFDADTPHQAMINGEATIGYMFGSQATAAKAELPTLAYVYPEEGLSAYIDAYVLADGAPNEDAALTFLNYVMDGKVSAKISTLINYTNANKAAQQFLPQEFLDNKMVNIPSEAFANSQLYEDVGEATDVYNEIWTAFKSK